MERAGVAEKMEIPRQGKEEVPRGVHQAAGRGWPLPVLEGGRRKEEGKGSGRTMSSNFTHKPSPP